VVKLEEWSVEVTSVGMILVTKWVMEMPVQPDQDYLLSSSKSGGLMLCHRVVRAAGK
jgi:hypothetical protein